MTMRMLGRMARRYFRKWENRIIPFAAGFIFGLMLCAGQDLVSNQMEAFSVVEAATPEESAMATKEKALRLLSTVELSEEDMNELIKLVPYEQSVEIRESLGICSCSDYIRAFINEVPGFADGFIAYVHVN